MNNRILKILCASLLLALTACAVQPEKPAVKIPFDAAAKGRPSHVIDTANSSAVIRVYSAGAMSKLGHNHLILSRDIRGEAWIGDKPGDTAFHLVFPVDSFNVDPSELRAQSGPDFASQPSKEDVQGTRRNMLGEKALNAAQYPVIEIWSERIRGSAEARTAEVVVAARGQLSRIVIPMNVSTTNGVTRAKGKFSLKQSDIGITPFSIMMGAIAVRDELEIEYSLTANIN
jgi:hypothetical protein